MSNSAGEAPHNQPPSGTVLAEWSDNSGVVNRTKHRIVVGGAGDEFVVMHQRKSIGRTGAAWTTKETWEAANFPDVLPEGSE